VSDLNKIHTTVPY